ncbi:MAG: cytochrome b N-terminal domain-containing protein [Rhizobiaceae bacterium]|nr:cytochrome b N-terminal domain-containing protein [Hyphomicrobiales bacterium]NRB31890.1 cytochrome b N-terminal domain-containing protein [Rhizobiaceae bacterium]
MSGHSTYKPTTGLGKFMDERLPIVRLVHDSFVSFPVPRNLNNWYTFGGILMIMLVSQIITGIVIAMHYTPEATMAFDSVHLLRRDVSYGNTLQVWHAVGASMFFVAVYIHIFRGLYYGSYKAPREVLWILGVVIYLLMMATAFMGYVLPWGQMSYWGAQVITSFFSAIPLVGETVREYLLGGYAVGNATLNRFFSLHYLLPFMIAGIVILHVWTLHVTGQTNPTGVEVKSKQDVIPFTPYATVKDAFAMVVFMIIMCYFVFYMPDYLGHADNYIKADPLTTPAHIVPEWYFLPFYAVLRAVDFNIGIPFTDIVLIDSKLGGVLAMFGAIAVLFFVPWLDTSDVKSANYRPTYKIFFWIFAINAVFLGYLGSRPAEGIWIPLMKASTFWYFLHFIVIMPLLGWFEKPLPRPASITDAVLSKASSGGASQIDGAAAEPQSKG